MNFYSAKKAEESLWKTAWELGIENECHPVLGDHKFLTWSGSSKPHQHHYGDFGLITHTEEVARLCLLNARNLDVGVDEKLLFLSALYHDIGKTYDYEKVNEVWGPTNHKRHIHHISRSSIIFNQKVDSLTDEEKDQVTHAILAHHGLREWGSPVMPNTQMAWLLHLCDNISARMNDSHKWDHTKL